MSNSKPNVGIIGAGPAGLSCALRLTELSTDPIVTVLEKGRNQRARICPVDIDRNCDGCKGICNVISGIGGCMHYGDSIKLSGYPSGRRLFELLGAERYYSLQFAALKFFGQKPKHLTAGNLKNFFGLSLRQYPISEIGARELECIIDNLRKKIELREQKIVTRSSLQDLSATRAGKFYATVDTAYGRKEFLFDKVVFATGRAGFASTDNLLTRMGVERIAPTISIGVRLEMSSDILSPLYLAHKDFKFSEWFDGVKIKSFCFSNFDRSGGRIKYCHYQDQFSREVVFLDGHSSIEAVSNEHVPLGRKGNFALLAQLPKSFDAEWLNGVFVKDYYKISQGKPIYEPLNEFIGTDGLTVIPEPSVSDCIPFEVGAILPKNVANALRSACVSVVDSIGSSNSLSRREVAARSIVLAPEVEFFWPRIGVNRRFETNVSGLYVVGDAAGIAQGNLQASICGIAAADDIVESL